MQFQYVRNHQSKEFFEILSNLHKRNIAYENIIHDIPYFDLSSSKQEEYVINLVVVLDS